MIYTGKTNNAQVNSDIFASDYGRKGNLNRFNTQLLETFELLPYYFKIYKRTSANNEYSKDISDAWIIDSKKSYDDKIPTKEIIMKPPQELSLGEIYKIPDWNNENWMVTELDPSNLFYNNGQITKCNFNLEYTNDVGKKISMPCVLRLNKRVALGIQEDKYMIVGDNQRVIDIQNNEETIKFKRDDKFVIDGLTYKISSLDRAIQPNLCVITLIEYQDNIVQNNVYTLNIQESNLSFTIGETKQLTVTVKENDTIIDKPIVYTSSDTNIATVGSNGLITGVSNGNCTITASLRDNNTITDSVSVEITDIITPNIEYRFGSNNKSELTVYDKNNYSFYKYINNIADNTVFTFEIDYNSNSISIATLQVVDGNHCTVIANSSNIYGTIYLVAKENGIEQGRLGIKVKSAW